MARLNGKVCIITGGGGGIGAGSALMFAGEGAVVYAIDVNEAGLAALVAKHGELGLPGRIETRKLDVTNSAEVNACVDAIKEKEGRIDVLVNNAGITRDAMLVKMTDEQFDQVIAVNLKGCFNMGRACAKHMMLAKSGSIINTSSVVGVYGNFGQTNYAATKAGLIGMTKTWSKELARKGVRVNAVAPGFITTEMTAKIPEKVIATITEKIPMQTFGTIDDVARLYLFLASDESAYITNQVIGVDGGLTL